MTTAEGKRALRPGVYGPLPTFFDDNQELDLVSYKKHLLSESITVIKGSNY
jgi:4-hydroxy-2-oxoglutarate aldolase